MNEVWKPITGRPGYEVSNHGRIKSLGRRIAYKDGRAFISKERILKPPISQGYQYFRGRPVHLIVLEEFVCKREGRLTCNHKDGNKLNNGVENLEWATYAENNRHARLLGLNRSHGERSNLTQFSDDIVDAVRLLWPTNRFTREELGALFGMSKSHVYEIVAGRSRTIV